MSGAADLFAAPLPAAPAVRVSVVVPTYRRPDLLARCLAALAAQSLPAGAYEIIVADDGADQRTRELAARLDESHAVAVRYLPVLHTQGPAGARNAGWRAARGDIIAFTDDDTIPDADWLRAGLDALADGTLAAVTGRVEVPLPAAPTDHERDTGGLAHAEFVTANCFVRRTELRAVGGFDERYTRAWREDSDLQFALLERGLRIGHAPAARVVHPVRPAPWGNSIRQQAKVYFDALLFRKYPRLYRQRIRRRAPLAYYLVLLCLGTALAAGLAGRPGVAELALGGWALVTAGFAVKRLRGASKTLSHVGEMIVTSIVIPPLAMYWRLRGALRHRVLFF